MSVFSWSIFISHVLRVPATTALHALQACGFCSGVPSSAPAPAPTPLADPQNPHDFYLRSLISILRLVSKGLDGRPIQTTVVTSRYPALDSSQTKS